MPEEIPKFDPELRAAVLSRTPEEINADIEAQAANQKRLSPRVTDSIAVAYFKNAVGQQPVTADTLFWQGRFTEAAELAIGQNKQEYHEFAGALVNLDKRMCDCPPVQIPNGIDAKGTSVSPAREIQRVYVATLQKEVKFIRCDVCGKLFSQTC